MIFWLAVPVNGLWGLAGPPRQGLMTRRTTASEQGQLQGALSSLREIAFMIGPLLFTNTFRSIHWTPARLAYSRGAISAGGADANGCHYRRMARNDASSGAPIAHTDARRGRDITARRNGARCP